MDDADLSRRPWTHRDLEFLWEMLYLSIHVTATDPSPPRSVLHQPEIAHYLSGFGERPGDDAQVCEDAMEQPIGAAWCRRFSADDPGYGFVADDIPELGMAVVAEWRGRGIGRALLEDLLTRHPTMSLSVDDRNLSATALYRSLGFLPVKTIGGSTTMLLDTAADRS